MADKTAKDSELENDLMARMKAVLAEDPATTDTAYDGSNRPQERPLTARERDILVRVLQSLVYPYYPHNQDDPYYAKAREAFRRYTRLDNDPQVIYNIIQIINPREE